MKTKWYYVLCLVVGMACEAKKEQKEAPVESTATEMIEPVEEVDCNRRRRVVLPEAAKLWKNNFMTAVPAPDGLAFSPFNIKGINALYDKAQTTNNGCKRVVFKYFMDATMKNYPGVIMMNIDADGKLDTNSVLPQHSDVLVSYEHYEERCTRWDSVIRLDSNKFVPVDYYNYNWCSIFRILQGNTSSTTCGPIAVDTTIQLFAHNVIHSVSPRDEMFNVPDRIKEYR